MLSFSFVHQKKKVLPASAHTFKLGTALDEFNLRYGPQKKRLRTLLILFLKYDTFELGLFIANILILIYLELKLVKGTNCYFYKFEFFIDSEFTKASC